MYALSSFILLLNINKHTFKRQKEGEREQERDRKRGYRQHRFIISTMKLPPCRFGISVPRSVPRGNFYNYLELFIEMKTGTEGDTGL